MTMTELPRPAVAHLAPADVAKVEAVEKTLGDVYVVAYEKPAVPAQLTPEQVQVLQQAERDLGVCLIAYQAQH
jgi:hypothetical protein